MSKSMDKVHELLTQVAQIWEKSDYVVRNATVVVDSAGSYSSILIIWPNGKRMEFFESAHFCCNLIGAHGGYSQSARRLPDMLKRAHLLTQADLDEFNAWWVEEGRKMDRETGLRQLVGLANKFDVTLPEGLRDKLKQ